MIRQLNEIAFVLPVLIIHNNDDFAGAQILHRIGDGIKGKGFCLGFVLHQRV
ncbi:MAG: hypothetical protein BWY83_03440 [bacterium ADurb.Bin478]|nr:MAG: hypothetical protein BWY83_03440 [bacterium ADurb.Bin478]